MLSREHNFRRFLDIVKKQNQKPNLLDLGANGKA
jgi:hypothetical protein